MEDNIQPPLRTKKSGAIPAHRKILQVTTPVGRGPRLRSGSLLPTLHSLAMSESSQSLGHAEKEPDTSYEMEDPAASWIELVQACQLPDDGQMNARKEAVAKMLFLAKISHWTIALWNEANHGYQSDDTDLLEDIPTEFDDFDDTAWERYAHNSNHGGDHTEAQAFQAARLPKENARTKVTARASTLTCRICGLVFATHASLNNHMSVSHRFGVNWP